MKNKIRLLIREQIEDFITHENGGRAFSVHKDDEYLYIFKNVLKAHDILNVFTGDKEDGNSSVLVELAANEDKNSDNLYHKEHKHKYLFIGTNVYSFETDEPIIKYYSKIGNSDVPYPIALSKDNVYFMLDTVFVDKSKFPKNTDWKDAYTYFYDHKDLKKEKFYNLEILEKSPLNEQKIRPIIRECINQIIKEEIKQKKLGQLGLDSGQAIIIDPSHLNDYKEDIEKMQTGKFNPKEDGVKSLGKHNTGLYLSLFGGDGTFDIYGVYDTTDEWPHIPYKIVIHTRNEKDFPKEMNLYEGTGDFYPGYSDDGTSDTLADIREKTSPIVNKELKNLEGKLIHYKDDDTKEKDEFWAQWMYANLITTCLQDKYYIVPELIEKAKENYRKCLSNPMIREITEDSYESFVKQVEETLAELENEKPLGGDSKQKDYYYAPWFMEKRNKI
jgi:hypothetical protein